VTWESSRAALGRVFDGRVDPAEPTREAAEELWVRLVAEGHIVDRFNDRERGEHQVRCTLVEHHALPAGQVYAVFGMGSGPLTVYRCTPEDARLAILDPGAFNL
jgi:hypothetical protein